MDVHVIRKDITFAQRISEKDANCKEEHLSKHLVHGVVCYFVAIYCIQIPGGSHYLEFIGADLDGAVQLSHLLFTNRKELQLMSKGTGIGVSFQLQKDIGRTLTL